jgi:hypothetical protein
MDNEHAATIANQLMSLVHVMTDIYGELRTLRRLELARARASSDPNIKSAAIDIAKDIREPLG